MKFRIYKKLSNVGLWTISTRWWQNLTVGEAIVAIVGRIAPFRALFLRATGA